MLRSQSMAATTLPGSVFGYLKPKGLLTDTLHRKQQGETSKTVVSGKKKN